MAPDGGRGLSHWPESRSGEIGRGEESVHRKAQGWHLGDIVSPDAARPKKATRGFRVREVRQGAGQRRDE